MGGTLRLERLRFLKAIDFYRFSFYSNLNFQFQPNQGLVLS
jgi:hypothetical protein